MTILKYEELSKQDKIKTDSIKELGEEQFLLVENGWTITIEKLETRKNSGEYRTHLTIVVFDYVKRDYWGIIDYSFLKKIENVIGHDKIQVEFSHKEREVFINFDLEKENKMR